MFTVKYVLRKSLNTSGCVIIKRNLNLLNQKAFINGEWICGTNNKTFEVKNPADGCVVGVVPNMDTKDLEIAIQAAHCAFQTWQNTTAKERSYLLRKWYNLLVTHAEDIAKIMTLESGKPLIESRGEVVYGNSFVEWFSEEARRIDGEIIASPVKSKKIFITKQPIGVAGLITPWNFPHAMITRKSGAALAAGCTCIIKPGEDTPLTALAIAELAEEAGFPSGVFNVVTSDRDNAPAIGKLLCESPLVAGISFTGSTEVGKILYRQCASGIKRLGLELGGYAPFIVFESADVDKAVEGAYVSKFRNCGQTCVSSNHFYIHEKLFDKFVAKFKDYICDKLVMGNGMDSKTTTGPLINEAQFKKVHELVTDALCKGAKVVVGGKPATEFGKLYYEPTILVNVNDKMRCVNEEIFGPIACCTKFNSEKDILKKVNESTRGLAGYFYSRDVAQIFRVAEQLEVGMVGVNEGLISTTEAAFGGIKESGLGREGSHHGIDDYVNIKYMCLGNM